MNVIVKIEGRDAIPVRAIPLLTNWEVMSPDDVANALGSVEDSLTMTGICAYRVEGGEVKPIAATWWENFPCRELKAVSERIRETQITREVGSQAWRRESLPLLPAGVFVWRDEFEKRFYERYGRHRTIRWSNESGVLSRVAQVRRLLEARTEFGKATAWLAQIVRAMQSPFASASRGLSLGRLVSIDIEQQGKKTGVLQQGVANWNRL